MSSKTFPTSAEAFLDRFVNLERSPDPLYPRKLERMTRWLEALGNPDRAGYRVLTVAGTKGKGSTAAMIASVLECAGRRTGLYTSPHLESWTERIRVDGKSIDAAEADAIACFLEEHAAETAFPHGVPTYFEMLTAMALVHFAAQHCEAAVLEVGLGGEYDAMNACRNEVAVITPIGRDHERVLGTDPARIARAKCGIIQEGSSAVSGLQGPEAMRVIEETSRRRAAPLLCVGKDAHVEPVAVSESSQAFFVRGPWGKEGPFDLPLVGAHQAQNAATAYLALRVFSQKTGFKLTEDAIARGFRAVSWPGRIETVSRDPRVVLDGAHTPESARALREALARHFTFGRLEMVLGMLNDKDPAAFLEPFRGLARGVRIVEPACERSFGADEIAARIGSLGIPFQKYASLESALKDARDAAGRDGLVLVTGSLYLVGEARKLLA